MHNILAHKYIKVAQLFIIAAILIFIGTKVHLASDGDDVLYLQNAKELYTHDFWFFLKNLYARYMIWSGRLTIDGILLGTIIYAYFWKITIPLSLLLLSISINRMVCNKISLNYTFCILLFLLLIPTKLNNETILWVTGFYVYLLPLSLATYVISFILSHSQSKIEFNLCILSVCIFAYTEQVGFYFLGLTLGTFFSNKKYRTKRNYFLFLLALVNYVILLKAPGNYARYSVAAWGFYPDYMDYTILPKISLGFSRVYELAVMNWNVPFWCYIGLLLYLYPRYGKKLGLDTALL